jgi:Beta-lactamase enzyme family
MSSLRPACARRLPRPPVVPARGRRRLAHALGTVALAACMLAGTACCAYATAFIEPELPTPTLSSTTFPTLGDPPAPRLPTGAAMDRLGGERIIRLQPAPRRRKVVPAATPKQFAEAMRWAKTRRGDVGFAVIDARGRLRGYRMDRQYPCASVVKAMLLVAYLRRNPTPGPGMRSTLRSMIEYSDNDAAVSVYRIVGDSGLTSVARRAGMTSFGANGWWSLSQITAADQARFFYSMDSILPQRSRPFARELLSHVISEHSWGIPRAARAVGWNVFFKGGWRDTPEGQLVHQAARLERGKERIAIAVLTDGDPTQGYGIETVRGIADRLVK